MVAKCKCPKCGKEAEYLEEKWICGCGWGKDISTHFLRPPMENYLCHVEGTVPSKLGKNSGNLDKIDCPKCVKMLDKMVDDSIEDMILLKQV